MAQANVPNQYNLTGEGITVGYSTSSIGGKPQLSYKKGRQTLSFSGDEIRTADTEIGTLVTVTITKSVDRGFTDFTVLLPRIQLSSGTAKQSFRTIGITTAVTTTIGGPVKGAQQTYKTVPLSGKASQVEFLAQRTAGA
jgi:hypothetical protein